MRICSFINCGVLSFVTVGAICFTSSTFGQVTSFETPDPNPKPATLIGKKWADMDYGPAKKFSVQVSKDNIAYKGLAVRLDPGLGGISSGSEFMMFDTDTLRWAGGWTGPGFVDWKGIALNGEHEIHPSRVGDLMFHNPVAPGWGHPNDGRFEDERVVGRDGLRYGPLARDWGKWNGHYVHGNRVILSYRIGKTEVLEMPGMIGPADNRVTTRTMNIGPREKDLVLQVAAEKSASSQVATGRGPLPWRFIEPETNEARIAWVSPSGTKVEWATEAGQVRLAIPAGEEPLRITILIGPDTYAISDIRRTIKTIPDLSQYTKGGPAHWPEVLETKGVSGSNDGPYAVDTITHPAENPYRAWLRFSGFDFFEDDSKAAISTWNGDIWLVSGIGESLENLKWQRIASGMFQPLGIKIVDGDIYAICRDQITILRDLNGDGETDYYENFNSDHQVHEHFHEFALDLKLGTDGDFYYTKGGRHADVAVTPNHGTLIRVSRDGSESEFVANGFRAPNGLGLSPTGDMLVADNQGHWIPANRINWIKPGGFYGYMWGYHDREESDGFDEPMCWIHPSVDRSPGTFAWVPDYRWGPLKDKIISASYGMGQIYHVFHEEIDGIRQGGVVKFPLEFNTGVTRAAFRPRDGQLYLAGLFGWAGNKTKPGGFFRVRYTGKPIHMPEAVNIASDGVVITYTDPLDADSATDPGNYTIQHWNYKWTARYGSDDFKMDGSKGRDSLEADQIALSPDRKTVYLHIPGIRPVMQMDIRTNIEAADGTDVRHQIHHTIHTLGKKSIGQWSGTEVTVGEKANTAPAGNVLPGLDQELFVSLNGNQDLNSMPKDNRSARLPAMYVKPGQSVSPFLPAGQIISMWTGFIESDLNENYQFSVEGTGNTAVMINDQQISLNEPVVLKKGLNAFALHYTGLVSTGAEMRLYWESEDVKREPVPATAFHRSTNDTQVITGTEKRIARQIFAEHRCMDCHGATSQPIRDGMPELALSPPDLTGAGSRFSEAWLAQWIADPQSVRPDVRMHKVGWGNSDQRIRGAADIAAYLTSVAPKSNASSRRFRKRAIREGEQLYNQLGCIACHAFSDDIRFDAIDDRREQPVLDQKWNSASLTAFLKAPETHKPGIGMPNFRLTDDEAESLTAYLMTRTTSGSKTNTPANGDPARGRDLIRTVGCLNCHAFRDETLVVVKATSRLSKNALDTGCLSDSTGQHGRAPEFEFNAQEKNALRSFIRNDMDSLNRFVPAEYAERQIERLNCAACHALHPREDFWSWLVPKEEVTADDESIHVGRPHLNAVGEKLNTDWMTKLFKGELDYKPRPGLKERMPGFPHHGEKLAQGLAALHGFPPATAGNIEPDLELAAIGKELATNDEMFRCNTCHGMGSKLPLAGADTETINFKHIPDRLRNSFFHRFLLDPQRTLPGTQMPEYVDDDGVSTITNVLDGDIEKQFDAIWQFMLSLE
jgi:mono/diheme cytochrome c family protein